MALTSARLTTTGDELGIAGGVGWWCRMVMSH